MNTLRKGLVIAIATLGLGTVAAAAPSQVAQAPGTSLQSGATGQHGQKFAERMAKRQAKLHDKLALTPAQEGAWQLFTARMQATAPTPTGVRSAKALTAPERAERKAAFANFREVALEECGHMMHHDQPARLAAVIEEFLAQR